MLRMHQPENIIDIVSAIIPVLLLNADVWFMFIPKKIFVLIQAPFVAYAMRRAFFSPFCMARSVHKFFTKN